MVNYCLLVAFTFSEMKHKVLTIATCLTALTFSFPICVLAQNPPAETYQPGYWQPVNRFDPARPVQVKLVNQAQVPLEYDFTAIEVTNPQPLLPEETRTLKDFGNTAYIVIYPTVEIDPSAPFTLKYNVDVTPENIVMVTIEKAEPGFFGNRVLNLQKTGAIFLY